MFLCTFPEQQLFLLLLLLALFLSRTIGIFDWNTSLPAPILAVKLFITVTVAVSFFRLIPVFKSCTLKRSKVVFPIEGYSGEGTNKILMPCSLSSHSWVALPNIYGLNVELVLVVSCLRVLLLTSDGKKPG